MFYILLFFMRFLYAEDSGMNTDKSKNEVNKSLYVMPIKVTNKSSKTETYIYNNSAFNYASQHWKNSKVKNEKGAYEPILMHYKFNVYNQDSIKYASKCDFVKNPMKCSNLEKFYLVETVVYADDYEMTVYMTLYDKNLIVLNQSSVYMRSEVNWIKQQAVTITQNQGMFGNSTAIDIPKEELPLEWIIPAKLFDDHIYQASMLLWTGIKID